MGKVTFQPSKPYSRLRFAAWAILALASNLATFGQVVGPAPERPLVWSMNGVENGLQPHFSIDARGPEEQTLFRYYTIDGTAKAGVDYIAVSGTGTNWGSIDITVPNDGKVEPPKTLKLVVIQEGTPSKTNTVEVTIFDDEIPRSVDTSFKTDFQPFSPGFVVGLVDAYMSGRVLANGNIVILEPGGFTVLDKNGFTLSRHAFTNTTVLRYGSAVTPAGNILVARQNATDGNSILSQYLSTGENDEGFHPELPIGRINSLAVTPQGKIIVSVTTFPADAPARSQVIQLNSDGSLDSTVPSIDTGVDGPTRIGVGVNEAIQLYFQQPFGLRQVYRAGNLIEEDYSYVVGAWIYPKTPDVWVGDGLVKGVAAYPTAHYLESTSLYRLRADGSLDESFVPGFLATQFAYIGTQSDGKVFVFANGKLMRLNTSPEQVQRVYIESFDGLEEAEESRGTIRRTGDTTQPLTVRLQVTEGSATAGADFLPLDRLVTFEPFSSTAQANVVLLNDALSEGPETFVATISNASNNALIERSEYIASISDLERFVRLFPERSPDGLLITVAAEMTGVLVRLESSSDLGKTWVDVGNFSYQTTVPMEPAETPKIFRAVRLE